MTSTHKHIALVPRDGLFFKDGRGWFTSESGRARSMPWPSPTTLRGAMRSALGLAAQSGEEQWDASEWPDRTSGVELGATFALRREHGATFSSSDRMWPAPADAIALEKNDFYAMLVPKPNPADIGSLDGDDSVHVRALERPRLDTRSKPRSAPRWWTDADLVGWMCGQPVGWSADADLTSREVATRTQTHVSVDASKGTAAEGLLFQTEILEFADPEHEWAIAMDLKDGGLGEPDAVIGVGGKRRLTEVEALDASVFEVPAELLRAFEAGPTRIRLMLVTPGHFSGGWLLDGFAPEAGSDRITGSIEGIDAELVLKAALVGRPEHVSGWDMAARCPKGTRRLAPAGSIYHLERADGGAFSTETARALWLAQVGSGSEEGLGRCVAGITY